MGGMDAQLVRSSETSANGFALSIVESARELSNATESVNFSGRSPAISNARREYDRTMGFAMRVSAVALRDAGKISMIAQVLRESCDDDLTIAISDRSGSIA